MLTPRVLGLVVVGGAAVVTAQSRDSLHVCVGADRVVRFEPRATCPAGTTGYEIALAEGKLDAPPQEQDEALPSRVDDLRRRIDILNSKLAEVQRELGTVTQVKAGGKVMAPFEVVDNAGKMIFRIRQDPRGVELATATGQSVAWMSALAQGGMFKTRSVGNFPEVVMGSNGAFGGFTIRDAENLSRISLMLSSGKPSLEMSNDNHVNVVSLMQGSSGGGFLQLGSAAGNAQVQAGVTAGGCGKVETYPERKPGGGMVGAPVSFIVGRC